MILNFILFKTNIFLKNHFLTTTQIPTICIKKLKKLFITDYLLIIMTYDSFVFEKYYVFQEKNKLYCDVYDHQFDLINSKIILTNNLSETERINSILEKIYEQFGPNTNTKFFEKDDKIYVLIINKNYMLISSKNEVVFKYCILCIHENNYSKIKEIYVTKAETCFIANNNIFMDNSNSNIIKKIDGETKIKLKIKSNYVDHFEFCMVNDKIYCCSICHDELLIYFIDCDGGLIEPKIINIGAYGKIISMETIKEKIYMLMSQNLKVYIVIYDIISAKFEINLDLRVNGDMIMRKFGEKIILHDEDSNILDSSDYQIISLKPNIKNVENFDTAFEFI